jgi:uncharacterized protein YjbI with pentapeptide repeats
MSSYSRATIALVATAIVATVLLCVLLSADLTHPTWIPQTVVTLAGLVGASWFAGNRLDLFDKDIRQRQAFADDQRTSAERTNFNSAVKEAVEMMSSDSPSTVLAGQRWLHTIADVGPAEARLVQTLLCNYVVNTVSSEPPETPNDPALKGRQSALALLFQSPGNKRFTDCESVPDMTHAQWRALDFTDLKLRGANLARSDFTDAVVVGAQFDECDLRDTLWSDVGGNTRTPMCNAKLCGAKASSAIFTNIDFAGANLSNNGRDTRFQFCTFVECNFQGSNWTGATFKNCKFIRCDFENAIWDGAVLDTPQFDQCPTVTFDLCAKANMREPAGLPSRVNEQLRRMGLNDTSHDADQS